MDPFTWANKTISKLGLDGWGGLSHKIRTILHFSYSSQFSNSLFTCFTNDIFFTDLFHQFGENPEAPENHRKMSIMFFLTIYLPVETAIVFKEIKKFRAVPNGYL